MKTIAHTILVSCKLIFLPIFVQESPYASSMNTSLYKFGLSESGNTSYYDYCPAYVVSDHIPGISEYRRIPENSTANLTEHMPTINTQCEGYTDTTSSHATPVECKFIDGLIWYFVCQKMSS